MQTVLFLAHEPSVERGRDEAGTLADAAADLGYDVAIGLVGSDALLPDPSSVDAVVVLGSLESAYDDTLRWLGTEIDYLRTTLAAGTPTLGVCFGGQLLSRILGGVVARSPRPEVGFVSIDAEQPGMIESGPWMQWHFDHFTLPPGARRLAYNTAGEQAFALGRAVGLQFHPEISTAAFANWRLSATVESEAAVHAQFGVHPDELAARIEADADDLAARSARLFATFLEVTHRSAG